MAKATQIFCAFLMIVMLFGYPASGRPNDVSSEDAGVADEQSPDFRHRWGSQQYQRPGQHYRPSTWQSSNTGWGTNNQYYNRRPAYGGNTQNMMGYPSTSYNTNWNRHQGMNQYYPNSFNNAAGMNHQNSPNILLLAFRDQEQDESIVDGAGIDGSQDAAFLAGNTEVGDIEFN